MKSNYKVFIIKNALKELELIYNSDKTGYNLIKRKIKALSLNPWVRGVKKLKGREGYRIKAGKFRIIYEVDKDNKEVLILHIGLRKDVYRK